MRDRTKSRRYSPEREEFRRTHARHRAWGLAQRHAERLRQLRGVPRSTRPDAPGHYPPRRPPGALTGESVSSGSLPATSTGHHPATSGARTSRRTPGQEPLTRQDLRRTGDGPGGRAEPDSASRAEGTQPAGTRRSCPAPVEKAPADDHGKPPVRPTVGAAAAPVNTASAGDVPEHTATGAGEMRVNTVPERTTMRQHANRRPAPNHPAPRPERRCRPMPARVHVEITSTISPRLRECDKTLSDSSPQRRGRSPPLEKRRPPFTPPRAAFEEPLIDGG